MSNICNKCGKELENGQICNCSNESKKESNIKNNEIMDNLIDLSKNIIKKPYEKAKEYISKQNILLSLILIIISSVIIGLFIYFLIYNGTKDFASSISKGIISNSMIELQLEKLKENMFSIIMYGTIIMIIGYVVLSIISKVCLRLICKVKINIKECFIINGINSALTSTLYIVAILFIFASLKLAVITFIITSILYFVSLSHLYMNILKSDKEKIGYAYALALILALIAIMSIIISYINMSAN